MKRFLIGLSIVLILIVATAVFFLRSSSGFRSFYLIPENAVLLVESKDPLLAWDKIVHSQAWTHLSTNKKLQTINNEIISADSLVSSSKFLMKLVGKKPILISQHPVGNGKYEMLYIIEIGKVAKYKKPEKILGSALGKDYEITSRSYKDFKIVEVLDLKRGEYYFLSLVNGKLVFSFDPKLVEASIDASEKMVVGRETKFLNVYSKAGGEGLISLYINHNNLGPFIETFSSETQQGFLQNSNFLFSGISFDINNEGLLTLEAYTSLTDSTADIFEDLLNVGDLELESAEVIPQRLASLAKLNFKDANNYFQASMKTLGKDEYESYIDNLEKIEKKFKISLEDNFFSWMDKEIVFLQTKPSNLGRNNEFAVILHASDSADAAKNLQFLWRQIKKNSPVKIKSVPYKGYKLDYIAFPGFLKMLFGKALSKIEKPYFTQIGNNVIVSNHPQTLKNLIDDYLSHSCLDSSIEYYNFNKLFGSKTSLFAYFEPPVLYHNLKEFLSAESWQSFKKDKEYFTCFSQAGAQIDLNGDLLHYTLKALYKPEEEVWEKQYYNTYEMVSLFNKPEPVDLPTITIGKSTSVDTIPYIVISELDADKQEDYYEDGSLKRIIELKEGMKHGSFKEYYPNGELKIKGTFDMGEPTGKWKYYSEDGELRKTDRY